MYDLPNESLKEMCVVSGFHRIHRTWSVCPGSAIELNSWRPYLSELTRCGHSSNYTKRAVLAGD